MNHQHLANVQKHIGPKIVKKTPFCFRNNFSFYFKTHHNFLGSWSNKLCARLTSNRWAWHEVGYFGVCENLLVEEHSYFRHLFVVVLLMYKEFVPFFSFSLVFVVFFLIFVSLSSL